MEFEWRRPSLRALLLLFCALIWDRTNQTTLWNGAEFFVQLFYCSQCIKKLLSCFNKIGSFNVLAPTVWQFCCPVIIYEYYVNEIKYDGCGVNGQSILFFTSHIHFSNRKIPWCMGFDPMTFSSKTEMPPIRPCWPEIRLGISLIRL